jgi:hypothetical protein
MALEHRGLGHDDRRVGVGGVVAEVRGDVEERHRRGHSADADRTEEDGGERRRVVEDHQHALLAPHSERAQRGARPAHALVQLGVRELDAVGAQRHLVAPAGLEIAVNERADVEALGDLEHRGRPYLIAKACATPYADALYCGPPCGGRRCRVSRAGRWWRWSPCGPGP